jgi:hypothetical protein
MVYAITANYSERGDICNRRFANKFEWGVVWLLCKDEAGFCSKDAIRGVYDGSFFVFCEQQINAKKAQKLKKSE